MRDSGTPLNGHWIAFAGAGGGFEGGPDLDVCRERCFSRIGIGLKSGGRASAPRMDRRRPQGKLDLGIEGGRKERGFGSSLKAGAQRFPRFFR